MEDEYYWYPPDPERGTIGHYQGVVWNKTGYSRGIVATLAGVAALLMPKVGETVFCAENRRILTFDGDLWMCDDFIKSVNGAISTRLQGDAMVFDNTIGSVKKVIPPTVTGDPRFAGIVAFPAVPGAPIALAFKGQYQTKITLYSDPWNALDTLFAPIRTTSLNGGMETIASYVGTPSGHAGWLMQKPSSSTPGLRMCLLRGKTEYYF